jgi:DNA-binding HxlR family transcriptional regulator
MAALDLLGRRWTLRIVWELRMNPVGFRALSEKCDAVSTAVLRERLVELMAAGLVIQHEDRSYLLTGLGNQLITALEPLDGWAKRWSKSLG